MNNTVEEEGQLELLTTKVFTKNWEAAHLTKSGQPQLWEVQGATVGRAPGLAEPVRYKIIAHQGGTRSSKTYSLAQYFLTQCLSRPEGYNVTLVRQSLPALKLTALQDWEEVLTAAGLDVESMHNKSEKRYTFENGNYLEYLSVLTPADGQKIRGAKRVDLWCNEANELSLEVWRQLLLRTTGQAFIDFNPSDQYHWIWSEVETRADALFMISTYRDNPFLEDSVRAEILRYQEADPNYWAVYGEGKKGVSGASILTHWTQAEYWPELQIAGSSKPIKPTYGIDFGFTHMTGVVRQAVVGGRRYVEELLYLAGLTEPELISHLKEVIPDRNSNIFADAARPDLILSIKRAGFVNIKPAIKDVKPGLLELQSKPLVLIGPNLVSEAKGYKYKIDRATGKPTEEPVKIKDDLMDPMRYAAYGEALSTKEDTPITVHLSFKRK